MNAGVSVSALREEARQLFQQERVSGRVGMDAVGQIFFLIDKGAERLDRFMERADRTAVVPRHVAGRRRQIIADPESRHAVVAEKSPPPPSVDTSPKTSLRLFPPTDIRSTMRSMRRRSQIGAEDAELFSYFYAVEIGKRDPALA